MKVTVYPTSALVTREVEVAKGDGLTEVIVSPLPPQIVQNSLFSEGNDGIRILSTRFRTRQVMRDTREDVRKLEDEMKKLTQLNDQIQAQIQLIEKNLAMLGKLEGFTDKTAVVSTEKGSLNSDTIIKLATFVMEQRAEKSKGLVDLKQTLKDNNAVLEFMQRKMAELSAGTSRTEHDAVIVVERQQAGGTIRLNYLVNAASWKPQYKLRAGKADVVRMDYLAGLMQQTGEDWSNVEITLSTAQPMLNATPPDLKKLEVTLVPVNPPAVASGGGIPPGAMPMATVAVPAESFKDLAKKSAEYRVQAQNLFNGSAMKERDEAGKLFNEAAAFDQTRELLRPRDGATKHDLTGLSVEGPSVTYHLATKITVPSRHDEQVVEVAKIDFQPKFYYKCVPVLNPYVYRLADVVNTSKHILLPGEATMYQEGDFVGRLALPLVAIGEEFTVGFGVDPQLQVQRRMIDKSKTTQGGNQVLKYDYRILINSFKNEKVKMQVWDRLPMAESETAGISLVKSTPELSKDDMYLREKRVNNLLRWDVEVAPGMNNEKALAINYEFRLELDRQMAISGFISR